MFGFLAQFLNRFFTKFSYRQRFVFFGILYFLSVPLPIYWQFKQLNFWIEQVEWQSKGTHVQLKLNELLSKLLYSQLTSNEKILKEERSFLSANDLQIDSKRLLAELENLNNSPSEKTTNLGSNFSLVTPPFLDFSKLKKLINAIIKEPHDIETNDPKLSSKLLSEKNNALYNAATDEVLSLLFKTGYTYALFLSQDCYLNEFAHLALETLPLQQVLSKKVLLNYQTFYLTPGSVDQITPTMLYASDALKSYHSEIANVLTDGRKAFPNNWYNIKSLIDNYMNTVSEFLSLLEDGDSARSNALQLFEAINSAKLDYLFSASRLFKNSLKEQHDKLIAFKIALSIILAALTLLIYIFLKYRVLTNHLKTLNDHIVNLSKGEFSKCFCSKDNDEFGYLGAAFDEIVDSLHRILGSLGSLSEKLKKTFEKVKKLIEEQSSLIEEQSQRVAFNEVKSRQIADSCSSLSDTMQKFCQSSSEAAKAESASEGLKRMQEHMSNLKDSTDHFLVSFEEAAKQMKDSEKLLLFMKQVSDQANMLSLTASIETESVVKNKESFDDITKKIHLFSELCLESVKQIEEIIKEMFQNIVYVKKSTFHTLKEMREGLDKLFELRKKLSGIATAGRSQALVYESVTEMTQEIAKASKKLLSLITNLLAPIKDSSTLLEKAPSTFYQIETEQKELENILKNITFDRNF